MDFTEDDFAVYENGVKQTILNFSSSGDLPRDSERPAERSQRT